MATFTDPETGLILNRNEVHRKALEPLAIAAAASLRRQGHTMHAIAAMLGTNPGRVSEAIGKSRTEDPRQLTLL